MKIRKHPSISLFSLGVIAGFCMGLLSGLLNILPYHYLAHNMFRISLLSLQKNLNFHFAISMLVFPVLGFFYILIIKKGEGRENAFKATFILGSLLILDYTVYLFFHKSLLRSTAHSLSFVYRLVTGSMTLESFVINLAEEQRVFLVALGFLLFLLVFYRKINTEKIRPLIFSRVNIILAMVVLLLVVFFNLGVMLDKEINNPTGPNVVLLSIEATRADHLGCYGYGKPTSPIIDSVAGEGSLFTHMFVTRGLTQPSLTSIMTSSHPVTHGVRRNGMILRPGHISLAELLKDRGYRCGAFLTNSIHAIWRGFDKKGLHDRDDESNTEHAKRWLRKHYRKPFFLWIHFWQPHLPYQPPEPYDRLFGDLNYTGVMNGGSRQVAEITRKKIKLSREDLEKIISLYDGSIRYVDDKIGQILKLLDSLGQRQNSLVMIMADHGEDLYQRNFEFEHGASIYDSSLHIPFLVRLPDRIPAGTRIPHPVSCIDVAPTILELLDIEAPPYFQGQSLMGLINRQKSSDRPDYVISELEDRILSIRTKKNRYIFNPEHFHPVCAQGQAWYPIQREELYDNLADPLELNNIFLKNGQLARKLLGQLKNWKYYRLWSRTNVDRNQRIPDSVRERLKTLGYVH